MDKTIVIDSFEKERLNGYFEDIKNLLGQEKAGDHYLADAAHYILNFRQYISGELRDEIENVIKHPEMLNCLNYVPPTLEFRRQVDEVMKEIIKYFDGEIK